MTPKTKSLVLSTSQLKIQRTRILQGWESQSKTARKISNRPQLKIRSSICKTVSKPRTSYKRPLLWVLMEVCQCLMWTLLNIQTKNSLWLAQERSKSALCSHKSINSVNKMASALRYQILIKTIATLHAYSTMIWTKKPQQLAKSKLIIGSNSASLWAHSRLSSLAGLLNWPLRTIWIAWSVL